MKFEKQRTTHSLSNKIQLNNQDYLTFRNNPTLENTGRTVYSQQFDWRSLERYTSDQQTQQPRHNFKKNMRNVRSQDKYRQIQEQIGFTSHDQNGQAQTVQHQKTQELRAKINSLMKNIKKSKRTQTTFDKQIEELQATIEENDEEIGRMATDIQQLTEISDDNVNNYNNMLMRIKELEEQAKQMVEKCMNIDREVGKGHQDVSTVRSRDGFTSQTYKQMLQGMRQYQKMNQRLTSQISSFEAQIYKMQVQLQQLNTLDQNMKNI